MAPTSCRHGRNTYRQDLTPVQRVQSLGRSCIYHSAGLLYPAPTSLWIHRPGDPFSPLVPLNHRMYVAPSSRRHKTIALTRVVDLQILSRQVIRPTLTPSSANDTPAPVHLRSLASSRVKPHSIRGVYTNTPMQERFAISQRASVNASTRHVQLRAGLESAPMCVWRWVSHLYSSMSQDCHEIRRQRKRGAISTTCQAGGGGAYTLHIRVRVRVHNRARPRHLRSPKQLWRTQRVKPRSPHPCSFTACGVHFLGGNPLFWMRLEFNLGEIGADEDLEQLAVSPLYFFSLAPSRLRVDPTIQTP